MSYVIACSNIKGGTAKTSSVTSLAGILAQQHYRVHGSLKNLTPWERWKELELKTPLHEEAEAMFDPNKERIKLQNYWADLQQVKANKSKEEGQKQEVAPATS